MTGTESHQGVAAFASEIEYVTVDDLMAAAKGPRARLPFCGLRETYVVGRYVARRRRRRRSSVGVDVRRTSYVRTVTDRPSTSVPSVPYRTRTRTVP